MKKKTILIAGAVVLLAAGGIFFRVMKGMEKPVEYETRPTVSAEVPQTGDIVLYTAAQSVSQTVGQHKSNLKALGEMGYRVRIVPDRALAKGFFRIEF